MAQTKRFIALQAQLVLDKTNAIAVEAGILAVKAAYSNQDGEMALSLLNDTPQFVRKAFATWLRGYGVAVIDPARGSALYTLADGIVKEVKKQAKVFAILASSDVADVLAQEIKVRSVKKVKALEGTPASRAQKKMEGTIKALKKDDAEAGAYLNDVWAAKTEVTSIGFEDGQSFDLSNTEAAQVLAFIQAMRAPMRKAA